MNIIIIVIVDSLMPSLCPQGVMMGRCIFSAWTWGRRAGCLRREIQ